MRFLFSFFLRALPFRRAPHASGAPHRFPLVLRLLTFAFVTVIAVPAGFTLFFLYTQFYLPLRHGSDILLLQSELALEVVDAPRYERVKNWLSSRAKPPELPAVHNPFR